MTNLTAKLTALVATLLLSTTMITAAVGPAQADTSVVSAARVA